jgi:hypothetical protein
VCVLHKRKAGQDRTGQDRTGHSNTQHIDYMSVPNVGWDGKGGEGVRGEGRESIKISEITKLQQKKKRGTSLLIESDYNL